MVERTRRREGGREKELLSYDFCLSYDKLVQIFYCFYILMKCFCFYHNEEEGDLNISTPKIIFILFQPLIILFHFNRVEWCGPKMSSLPSRKVACV